MSHSPKSVLLLTGMHRSNTSFLAKTFQDAGLHIPADSYNREGHFEDEDFVQLHMYFIKKYKLKSRYSIVDYKKCRSLRVDHSDTTIAQKLIQQRHSVYDLFGWKDPRTCHFLTFWVKIIPNLKCVFIIRDPHVAVNSILKRHIERSKIKYRPDLWFRYHRFWQVCNQQILDFYKAHPDKSILIFTPDDILDSNAEAEISDTIIDNWKCDLKRIQLRKNYNKYLITTHQHNMPERINQKSQKLYNELNKLRSSERNKH